MPVLPIPRTPLHRAANLLKTYLGEAAGGGADRVRVDHAAHTPRRSDQRGENSGGLVPRTQWEPCAAVLRRMQRSGARVQ